MEVKQWITSVPANQPATVTLSANKLVLMWYLTWAFRWQLHDQRPMHCFLIMFRLIKVVLETAMIVWLWSIGYYLQFLLDTAVLCHCELRSSELPNNPTFWLIKWSFPTVIYIWFEMNHYKRFTKWLKVYWFS